MDRSIIVLGCGVWCLVACGSAEPGEAEGAEAASTGQVQQSLEAPTCDDGVQNGDEVAVDCGGSVCAACVPVQISGTPTFFTDWGTGYCWGITATNTLDFTISNWTVVVNLQGTQVTDSWNAIRSGSTGTITLRAAFEWNSVLAPGESDNSVGFCATRPPGAGSAASQATFTFVAP